MSTTNEATAIAPVPQAAFAFIQTLSDELAARKAQLPGLPDIALRVRRALADGASTHEVVQLVGSEPALAARLVQVADCGLLNPGDRIAGLPEAVSRAGPALVGAVALAFALSQLPRAPSMRGLERPAEALWQRSAAVAAAAWVVARRLAQVDADQALLAGLLHGVGKLYILWRTYGDPELVRDRASYHTIVRDWHAHAARALLADWDMPAEVICAVGEYEDTARVHGGPADLTDVLCLAHLLVSYREYPESMELSMQGVTAAARLQLDQGACNRFVAESREDIAVLRAALAG
ncbi:MAG TPA: HDOD domain-containing protein [Steroidobacteraceae bacterium]|nr:HDOD domain-containing protein [Steroidobacteraceae bacterium]